MQLSVLINFVLFCSPPFIVMRMRERVSASSRPIIHHHPATRRSLSEKMVFSLSVDRKCIIEPNPMSNHLTNYAMYVDVDCAVRAGSA
jgi:hypothetical protein